MGIRTIWCPNQILDLNWISVCFQFARSDLSEVLGVHCVLLGQRSPPKRYSISTVELIRVLIILHDNISSYFVSTSLLQLPGLHSDGLPHLYLVSTETNDH